MCSTHLGDCTAAILGGRERFLVVISIQSPRADPSNTKADP
uniref:Uncharacterized protein n=1 Tax=Anguilla anguilla TaxID=7936 RepID=A0A0E9TUR0_ANGAN